MLFNIIKIKKVQRYCLDCKRVLFEYYTIGNEVRNYKLLLSFKPIKEGNICYQCYQKEKHIIEEIEPLRKEQDKCTSIKEWKKIAKKITKVLNKNA